MAFHTRKDSKCQGKRYDAG
ncbi:uncharacterized protein G2W53_006271 [Senna tora]|uniref:Uncharacterized protein n=1 Tax=Senna tora TaxID=362788 RepID=A0A834X4F9_9FABA|nr:uncharacterized protein G2W53_006271 [Senna tora]